MGKEERDDEGKERLGPNTGKDSKEGSKGKEGMGATKETGSRDIYDARKVGRNAVTASRNSKASGDPHRANRHPRH